MPFTDFAFDDRLLGAIEALGFEEPTPIQAATFVPLLEGKTIIGRARTGSGKTAAFGLPLLQSVLEGGSPIRAVVLCPTRELALQVTEALRSFAKQLPLRIATIYGGAPYPPQFKALQTATVVVGTPGRVIDHIERGSLDLSSVGFFVLDEADEMLNMGFLDDVTTILRATPTTRQVALFSATMPNAIRAMIEGNLEEVVNVSVEDKALTTEHITQQWMRVPRRNKIEALIRVLRGVDHDTTLVFCRTRASCAEVADDLARRGVACDALHGDLNQAARERVLARLRARRLDVVIATDVAARGIDVDHITHVINYDLPDDTETYVHRIGRTGRVGREGTAISFATPKEKRRIKDIARRLKVPIDNVDIPSDAAIVRQERGRLKKRLGEALAQDPSGARRWLRETLEEAEWTAEEIAVAAVHLLAGEGAFEEIHDDRPPHWARKVDAPWDSRDGPPPGEGNWVDNNEVELFFPLGRFRNVRPGDFVGAIAGEAGIDGRAIGRVSIFDRKTFVGVSRDTADLILSRLDSIEIRGNTVPVQMARPRALDDERKGRPPFRKHYSRGKGKGNHGRPRHPKGWGGRKKGGR